MLNQKICAAVLSLAATCLLGGNALAQEVTELILIDAERDRDIGPLFDGRTVDLAETGGALNVRAEVSEGVKSVRFSLDGRENFQTESVAPFALGGDSNGDYAAWRPSQGEHKLVVTPYSESGASGTSGEPFAISFLVANEPKPTRTASDFADIESAADLGTLPAPKGGAGVVSGDLMRWHAVTVDFTGPDSSETASPNPFLHYRLNVQFTQGDLSYTVPGYFAGDGAGGPQGNIWRAAFSPPTTGTWNYAASFRAGFEINVSTDAEAGTPTYCDGATGQFTIGESDKTGQDFRAADKGLLSNTGNHYLTFAGSGKPWVKAGPDIPENLLGYVGFENTPKGNHKFAAHEVDWKPGNPDWGNGDGKRIIGAFNYIAAQGGNCVYFLPMNIGGDGKDTFPTIGEYEKTRYDNSKLDQWEILFAHAQSLGIFLHFQLAETESANENYHDGGQLGVERKLFYRQMSARFGHHPGLQYDIGEENDYGAERRIAFAASIKSFDPYDHPVTTHTHGNKYDEFYEPLLGNPDFDMTGFQGGNSNMAMANLIVEWRKRSAASGVKLAVSFDEPQKIENDLSDERNGYVQGRRAKMWPALISGAAGFEWYVQADGSGHGLDHRLDDFREMEAALNWSGYATQFLMQLPILEMDPNHDLGRPTEEGNTYVLAKAGEVYALYNDRTGAGLKLDLSGISGAFKVAWQNPRDGGPLQDGTVSSVTAGGIVELGNAPDDLDQDWVCLVTRMSR